MPRLKTRELVGELMDEPSLHPIEHRAALRALARLNALSNAADGIWRAIRSATDAAAPLRILDVATGSGDVLLAVARRARRAGRPVELGACDVSDVALAETRRRADAAGFTLSCTAVDATKAELPAGFDIVMCSLFLHHLSNTATRHVLIAMRRAARVAVVVSDLRRSRAGLALAAAASRAVTASPVVHVDALRSVRAAYSPAELASIAASALPGAAVRPAWPERLLLTWRRGTQFDASEP